MSDGAWRELWAAADALEGETDFATWAGGHVVDTVMADGEARPVAQMPYPVYTEAVERLRGAIGGCGLVVPYDWMAWDGIERYRDAAALADAPLPDVVRLLTAIVRSERFGDGNIEGALRSGLLPAAVARLRTAYG